MDEFCHRCHGVLPQHMPVSGRSAYSGLEPDAMLFCPHCSAPQIRLPEHMRPLAQVVPTLAATDFSAPVDPHAIDWPVALRSAAAVALIGAALNTAGDFSAFFSFLGSLWVLGCALLTVSQYQRTRPRGSIDARAGLRIGATAGVLMVTAIGISAATLGVIERFATHRLERQDLELAQQTKAVQTQVQAWLRSNGVSPEQQKQSEDLLASPWMNSQEVRAGSALAADALLGGLIVLLGSGLGASAGAVGARRRRLVRDR